MLPVSVVGICLYTGSCFFRSDETIRLNAESPILLPTEVDGNEGSSTSSPTGLPTAEPARPAANLCEPDTCQLWSNVKNNSLHALMMLNVQGLTPDATSVQY